MSKIFIIFILSTNLLYGAADKLKLGSVNWAPYYADKLKDHGFYAKLSKEVFKQAGYEVSFHFYPWTRALAKAKKGEIDGIFGLFFNKKRASYLDYTDKVYDSTIVFIKLKTRQLPPFKDIESLRPFLIVGERASAMLEEFEKMKFNTFGISDRDRSYFMLKERRGDIMLVDREVYKHAMINHEKVSKIRNLFEEYGTYKSFGIHNAISRKRPDAKKIVENFNRALKEMMANEQYESFIPKIKK